MAKIHKKIHNKYGTNMQLISTTFNKTSDPEEMTKEKLQEMVKKGQIKDNEINDEMIYRL